MQCLPLRELQILVESALSHNSKLYLHSRTWCLITIFVWYCFCIGRSGNIPDFNTPNFRYLIATIRFKARYFNFSLDDTFWDGSPNVARSNNKGLFFAVDFVRYSILLLLAGRNYAECWIELYRPSKEDSSHQNELTTCCSQTWWLKHSTCSSR